MCAYMIWKITFVLSFKYLTEQTSALSQQDDGKYWYTIKNNLDF